MSKNEFIIRSDNPSPCTKHFINEASIMMMHKSTYKLSDRNIKWPEAKLLRPLRSRTYARQTNYDRMLLGENVGISNTSCALRSVREWKGFLLALRNLSRLEPKYVVLVTS